MGHPHETVPLSESPANAQRFDGLVAVLFEEMEEG
jgi:hypothetical protein